MLALVIWSPLGLPRRGPSIPAYHDISEPGRVCGEYYEPDEPLLASMEGPVPPDRQKRIRIRSSHF